ncbi:hypothetical protein [Salinarchaeum laminariae]|uniref:hypothetical protein n=1 Tax=Salinarchaeum laminariae TaxID=869888 RepID=UPI0020BEEF98|nr:hypothetical protein [Salinarchaeum laminariae]
MNLRDREYPASMIAVDARTESLDTFENHLKEFRELNYTYIPLPQEDKYYNVKEGLTKSLSDDQWISPEMHLLDVLELLTEQPFLLYAEPDSSYKIINVADLNSRGIREMLYPPVAQLASVIASRIRDKHPDSEQLIRDMPDGCINAATVGGWYQDCLNDVEVHIAEHMNLTEIRGVLEHSRPVLSRICGFSDEHGLDEFRATRDLRNGVMHANSSLVRDREDIRELLDVIDDIQSLLDEAAHDG